MSQSVCRWGILGTAGIAQKNWQSIRNAENATLVGVASRDRDRAQQYIDQCQSHVPFSPVPTAFGSYEAMLESDAVDAVYIPLPTGLRAEWVIRAAEAGKHVMGEKPSGVNAAEVESILAACRQNNVQYMDGVMFMHSERLGRIRETIDQGAIGNVNRLASHFSFLAPEEFLSGNIRMCSDLEPLGVLGDLGWYNIRFVLWLMNYQVPQRVSGRLLTEMSRSDSPGKVPVEFSAELFFPHGISASYYCSFLNENQQWMVVSGSNGYLRLEDFVLPFFGSEIGFDVHNAHFDIKDCDFNMEPRITRHTIAEYSNSTTNSQETNLFRNFSAIVLSGQIEPKWGEIALKTQQVLDACLQSAQNDGAMVEM